MKAALLCLLLVAGTQICRAYPTLGVGSDCDDEEGGPGGRGGPGGSPLPGGPSAPGVPGGPSAPGVPGGPSAPGVPSLPGVPRVPGGVPGGVPCADGLPAVPVPGPAGSIDSSVNTAEETIHHGGNTMKHAARLDIHGTSQEALNGSDRAAIGGADIMNRFVPGSGSAALTAYVVPSGIAHLSAADASGAAIVASGGILASKAC